MGISALAFVLGLPAFAASGYLGILGCFARPARRAPEISKELLRHPRFTFVVPAHNEASGIARTVRSLSSVDYPADKFSVLVVADNCTDGTKEQAELAGARVIERNDTSKRGKGYALEYAFERLIAEGTSDALVVVDADTDVSANLLRAMADRLNAGELAMQAHYGVRNVTDSWRTQLMDFAFTLYHGVRSHAREHLRLSAGLRGNGMGFALETLQRVPHHSYSLVEDVEYGIALGMHGIRVAYVGEAEVRGEMVAGDKGSDTQRRRWEKGRSNLVAQYVPTLLARAVRERSGVMLDLALDLLTPPLSTIVGYAVVGSAATTLIVVSGLGHPIAVIPWTLALTGLTIYVARGIQMSSHGSRSAMSLLHAPKYALWKLALRVGAAKAPNDVWIRTTRAQENTSGRDN